MFVRRMSTRCGRSFLAATTNPVPDKRPRRSSCTCWSSRRRKSGRAEAELSPRLRNRLRSSPRGRGAGRTTMQTDATSARQFSSESSPVMVERFAPTRLKLLRELESSLRGSRQALLALDLVGIEQGTREQVGLVRELQRLPRRGIQMAGPALEQRSEGREGETKKNGASELPAWSREAAEEVRRR